MDFLRVRQLSKANERGFSIEGVTFAQEPCQNIAIAGETGSGKTTLLRMIAGLAQPDSGTIHFKNEPVIGPADKLIPGHKGIVYLSQQFELPNFLRVEQVLEYANEWNEKDAANLFEICRIEHLFKRRTDQLSGGEKQRIAIARLLIMAPELFLLDEPFSNTDPANKQILKTIIADISSELKMSFIMVSHEPNDTLSWADEILVMQHGKLVERGNPVNLYTTPQLEYSAGLFGRYNHLPNWLPGVANQPGAVAIIRPEQVLVSADQTRLKGTLIRVAYFGHYFEADILVKSDSGNDTSLIVSRSQTHPGETGSGVYLRIDPVHMSYVTQNFNHP